MKFYQLYPCFEISLILNKHIQMFFCHCESLQTNQDLRELEQNNQIIDSQISLKEVYHFLQVFHQLCNTSALSLGGLNISRQLLQKGFLIIFQMDFQIFLLDLKILILNLYRQYHLKQLITVSDMFDVIELFYYLFQHKIEERVYENLKHLQLLIRQLFIFISLPFIYSQQIMKIQNMLCFHYCFDFRQVSELTLLIQETFFSGLHFLNQVLYWCLSQLFYKWINNLGNIQQNKRKDKNMILVRVINLFITKLCLMFSIIIVQITQLKFYKNLNNLIGSLGIQQQPQRHFQIMITSSCQQIKTMMSAYIQLQVIVDPQTQEFFKTIGGQQYWQIVNNVFNQKDVIKFWYYCWQYWSDQEQKDKWFRQIFQFIGRRYKKFGCMVKTEQFYKALTNQNSMTPVQQTLIQNIQSNVFTARQAKLKQIQYGNSFVYLKQILKKAIIQKRSSYKKDTTSFFIQTENVKDYSQLIMQKLAEQQASLTAPKNTGISQNQLRKEKKIFKSKIDEKKIDKLAKTRIKIT